MFGKAHLLCWSLRNFSSDEPKRLCLILLQNSVVVGNHASPNPRKRSHKICQALRKESEKALGREKKMAPLHFRATS